MFINYRRIIREHIYSNAFKYFSLILCLLIGITAGALFVTVLPENRTAELTNSINLFCSSAKNGDITFVSTIKSSFINNIRLAVMLIVGSFSIFLTPIIYINIAAKGFVTGFTVGFMSMHFGAGGLLLSAVSVMPQSLFEFPLLLLLSGLCINRAFSIRKSSLGHKSYTKSDNIRFTYSVAIIVLFFAAAILIDSLLLTEFSKIVSRIIVS